MSFTKNWNQINSYEYGLLVVIARKQLSSFFKNKTNGYVTENAYNLLNKGGNRIK